MPRSAEPIATTPSRAFLYIHLAAVLAFCLATPYYATTASWISAIANTAVTYAIAPFTVAVLVGRRMWAGVIGGLGMCLAMVVAFYLADDLSSPYPFNQMGFRTYLQQALVLGSVVGLLGSVAARASSTIRWLIVVGVCGGAAAYQVRYLLIPDASSSPVDDAALVANVMFWSLFAVAAAAMASTFWDGTDARGGTAERHAASEGHEPSPGTPRRTGKRGSDLRLR